MSGFSIGFAAMFSTGRAGRLYSILDFLKAVA
jgi:hypothetical protein